MKKMLVLPLLLCVVTLFSQNEKQDEIMLAKIRDEGLNRSQVMDIAFYLTDANGPRLMQSPGYFKAANWAKTKLTSWGLQHVALEPWGQWGKGWELERFYFALTAPYYKPLIGFPKTFSTGTHGPEHAPVVLLNATDSTGLLAYKGKLRNKIVLLVRNDSLPLGFGPDANRYTDEQLKELAAYDPRAGVSRASAVKNEPVIRLLTAAELLKMAKDFAREEGALCMLSTSTRNSDGTVFVQNGTAYSPETPETFNDVAVSYEDYMTIQRLLQHKIPVEIDLEIKTKIYAEDQQGYNVIGEIPGRDKKLKDQLVMIGGHLDSWQGATGATDNAAGSAVMMEVMRILKTVGFKPRRSIRIALWGGEETGLHGSENYVRNHFMDTTTRKYNAAGDELSLYLNLDNGTGKIRGIYLQGNEAAKPVFQKWFEPFHDLGAGTLTLRNTGGTDFLSFDAIGLPGFQFIQDPMEYGSRTHHSNMDTYDHLSAEDLKQASTIIASFVYDAAQAEEKVPRKN
ncbi:MAG: M20/M25/M40 family metallo-hydrolase [Bacteroidota bacterium]|nr:M20/M25/M40 family metallo-hydrolase [Bacteroidota bacterium]MDP4252089.1 M20/M25/M40 family metallo-hydrolase [Bacteroidota bacterium]